MHSVTLPSTRWFRIARFAHRTYQGGECCKTSVMEDRDWSLQASRTSTGAVESGDGCQGSGGECSKELQSTANPQVRILPSLVDACAIPAQHFSRNSAVCPCQAVAFSALTSLLPVKAGCNALYSCGGPTNKAVSFQALRCRSGREARQG